MKFWSRKIVSYVEWTAISLCAAASTLFLGRMLGNDLMVVSVRTALEELGSERVIYETFAGTTVGILFSFIMIFGSTTTLYFCLFSEKYHEKISAHDTKQRFQWEAV